MNKFVVTSKRHYSAHHALLRAADNYLVAAEQQERFCSSGDFVSLLMSSLAVESLCNTAVDLIFPDWEDFASCSPMAKIRLICEKLEIPYNKQEEPFVTILLINQFRNKIAHAKPETLHEEYEITEEECNNLLSSDGPQSKLEKQVSIERARKALEAVRLFEDIVSNRLPENLRHLFYGDFTETART